MKQSIQEIIKEAKEQGFPTKVSQKDALDTLNSQYVKIEDATRNYMLDGGQYSQEDYYDLPDDLYQVREKHMRIFNKHGGAKIVIDVSNLVSLRKQVKDIPVIKRAKKKVERVAKTDRAATHKGECQICGREQKLPQGVLSIHGYTVDYGYFQGICPGSNNIPYEKSCDQLKRIIPQQEKILISLQARFKKITQSREDEGKDGQKLKYQLEGQIRQVKYWVKWAQKRVNNWVEKDLEAL